MLDAIAWALGGDRKRPSEAKRAGSATDPHLKGAAVQRHRGGAQGKAGSPQGDRPRRAQGAASSCWTRSWVRWRLDLPKFLVMSDKDKAKTLLEIIGVGDELARLELEEQTLYNRRTGIGQMRDQKKGAAADMPMHPDAPAEPVSAMELIQAQQEILARNGENQRKRQEARNIEARCDQMRDKLADLTRRIDELKSERAALNVEYLKSVEDFGVASKTAEQLQDESTAEIEAQLERIEAVNAKVRDNQRRADAEREAEELAEQYDDMTERIEAVRASKMALLDGGRPASAGTRRGERAARLRGARWDCMSGSEQLRVATAIVRKPAGVRVRAGGQAGADGRRDHARVRRVGGGARAWQVIATRVSTGGECPSSSRTDTAARPMRPSRATSSTAAPPTATDRRFSTRARSRPSSRPTPPRSG